MTNFSDTSRPAEGGACAGASQEAAGGAQNAAGAGVSRQAGGNFVSADARSAQAAQGKDFVQRASRASGFTAGAQDAVHSPQTHAAAQKHSIRSGAQNSNSGYLANECSLPGRTADECSLPGRTASQNIDNYQYFDNDFAGLLKAGGLHQFIPGVTGQNPLGASLGNGRYHLSGGIDYNAQAAFANGLLNSQVPNGASVLPNSGHLANECSFPGRTADECSFPSQSANERVLPTNIGSEGFPLAQAQASAQAAALAAKAAQEPVSRHAMAVLDADMKKIDFLAANNVIPAEQAIAFKNQAAANAYGVLQGVVTRFQPQGAGRPRSLGAGAFGVDGLRAFEAENPDFFLKSDARKTLKGYLAEACEGLSSEDVGRITSIVEALENGAIDRFKADSRREKNLCAANRSAISRLATDSGREKQSSIASRRVFTREQIGSMSMKEFKENRAEIFAQYRRGLIK